jgi:RNA polymerase sigma-70 factor (ECF subfamily)
MPQHNRFSVYSDEELMLLIHKGETGAFDALYERYGRRLMVYFTRMLNFNKTLAEDALQDLFMKIAEAPHKFDRNRSFKTWIFSVASNTCKNHYRHREVVARNHVEIANGGGEADESAVERLLKRLDGKQFGQMLQEALSELPPEKKEVFILRYQEEKSIAEIAEIQGCAEGSVKSRLHYTLKILEEKLKAYNPLN